VTIEQLGSLGELVAAVATVVTLVYLAFQIRENTNAIRSESRGRISSYTMSYAAVLGGNSEAASIFTRGLADLDSLNAEEQTQFVFLFSMIVNQAHDCHHEYLLGLSDRGTMEANSGAALRLCRTPGGREYWRLHSSDYSPEFQVFVNSALREIPNS